MSDGIQRRDFLKVIGVGGAGASLAGCADGAERLIPYVVPPEDITPGVATWYATVCRGCSANCGMWVRTREGRAVKVEGNPNHPVSQGALCARGHATLQHLYNPDRYGSPMLREGGELRPISWDEAEQLLAQRIRGAAGNVLFIGGDLGPSMSGLVDSFVSAVGGQRIEYQPLSDAPLREAVRMSFGQDVLPRYDFEAADFVLSFGNDFLETGANPVAWGRAFARMSGMGEDGRKGRLVYAGPRLSLTGLNADEWIPIRAGSEAALAMGIASALGGAGDLGMAGPYGPVLGAYDVAAAAQATEVGEDTIRELAQRFAEGPALALGPGVGGHHRNATAANLAAMVLNSLSGNVGRTVHLDGGPSASSRPYGDMQSAISAMSGGQVGVVMVHGTGNPAYSLPAASGFRDAFRQVGFKVSFASAPDETAALADLILPDRHFLEAWGDSEPRSGTVAVQQPVMQPVPRFEAKQTGDVLLSVATRLGTDMGAATFYEYLQAGRRDAFAAAEGGFDAAWRQALARGVVETGAATPDAGGDAADAPDAPAPQAGAGLRAPDTALTFDPPTFDGTGEFTLLVYPSSRLGAGEFANSPWMQETPDPVSKIVWHSWVEMNPHTAEEHGLREGDIVRVTSPYGSVEAPIWLYPGIREDTVAIPMGNGHTDFGRWATGKGVNPMDLLPAVTEQPSRGFVTSATTVTVEPTGERRRLATNEGAETQHDRPIAPAVAFAELGHAEEEHAEDGHGALMELQEGGGFVPVDAHDGDATAFPLEGSRHGNYQEPQNLARWGMAIDLDKCTGCSACVVACQAENNVPWVGEEQVQMGRDMHWMRIERYYEHVDATHASHLDVRILPMLCQHCSNAPCEPVCPVFATYHTPEGVNAQIYNRCVGTRYCANNCPYKVRVFNWYRYTDDVPEPMNWQWNPDVTVRENGVMEKCSFCMQRIRDAENRAAIEGREDGIPRDGEIVVACQQTCPAEAIVFGNLRDPDSRVSQVVESERTYRVLQELINTQPGVHYLKKVTFHEVTDGEH